jgi:peptide/nickel transport system substrate-binding protein
MRTYYWYLTAYLKKHGKIVLLSVVLAIAFFSILIPVLVNRFGQKPRLYVGLVGDFSLSSLPPVVQHQISRGLTTIATDGSAAPDIAERWTIEDEGRTYRFVIKKNLVWQDGTPFKPEDITYNFQGVEIITTPNDIVFKLPDAFVPFPNIVSQPILKIEESPYLFFFKQPKIFGLGEYRMISFKRNGERLNQLIIENNTQTLVYRFYLTEDDALLGFKRGEVDQILDISSPQDLATWPTVTVKKTLHTDRYLAVFLNNNFFPKNIRQALAYSLQKAPDSERALGPINPQSWAYLPGGKSYAFDQERALERLLDVPPQQPLNIELTTTVTFQAEAESIKQQWEELGRQAVVACQNKKEITDKAICANSAIAVTIRINNFPDTSSFQALLIGQESPPDPDQYYLWHSSQSTNFSQYKNTRIDSLLEKGRQTVDKNERLAIYQEFQQFFLEDVPAIFLRYLESYDVVRK